MAIAPASRFAQRTFGIDGLSSRSMVTRGMRIVSYSSRPSLCAPEMMPSTRLPTSKDRYSRSRSARPIELQIRMRYPASARAFSTSTASSPKKGRETAGTINPTVWVLLPCRARASELGRYPRASMASATERLVLSDR